MRKLLLLVIITSLAIIGCKKDEEQPKLEWNYDIKINKDTVPNLALNDIVSVTYVTEKKYQKGADIYYKINESNLKSNILDENGKPISNFDYKLLDKDTLYLKYQGKEEGIHVLNISFKNTDDKRVNKKIAFLYAIKDKNKIFTTEIKGGEQEIFQGDNVSYDIKIKPQNDIKLSYKIRFISFDEKDKELTKSKIKLNKQDVSLNEWYTLDDKDFSIITNSFNHGEKKLSFEISNGANIETYNITQQVKKKGITIDIKGGEQEIFQGDNISYTIKIKTQNDINISYKMRFIAFDENDEQLTKSKIKLNQQDISLNNWYTLEGKDFSIITNSFNYGEKKLSFEISNEVNTETFDIVQQVKKKEITIDIKGTEQEIFQGDNVLYTIKNKTQSDTKLSYKIKFITFDENDKELTKSKIKLNNQNISLNEWYTLEDKDFSIITNSFNYGDKKLSFEIANEFNTKTFDIVQQVKKKEIDIQNLEFKNEIVLGDKNELNAKIVFNYPHTNNIQYRTWISDAFKINDFETTQKIYENKEILENNIFKIPLNAKKEGKYEVNIQVKNEFGNESEVKKLIIQVDKDAIYVTGKCYSLNYIVQKKHVDCTPSKGKGNTMRDYDTNYEDVNGTEVTTHKIAQKYHITLGGKRKLKSIKYHIKVPNTPEENNCYGCLPYRSIFYFEKQNFEAQKEFSILDILINKKQNLCYGFKESDYSGSKTIEIIFETDRGEKITLSEIIEVKYEGVPGRKI